MNDKEKRQNTWVVIDEEITNDNTISIQQLLDGEWTCYTGLPWNKENPQEEIPLNEFLLMVLKEWYSKNEKNKTISVVDVPK